VSVPSFARSYATDAVAAGSSVLHEYGALGTRELWRDPFWNEQSRRASYTTTGNRKVDAAAKRLRIHALLEGGRVMFGLPVRRTSVRYKKLPRSRCTEWVQTRLCPVLMPPTIRCMTGVDF